MKSQYIYIYAYIIKEKKKRKEKKRKSDNPAHPFPRCVFLPSRSGLVIIKT